MNAKCKKQKNKKQKRGGRYISLQWYPIIEKTKWIFLMIFAHFKHVLMIVRKLPEPVRYWLFSTYEYMICKWTCLNLLNLNTKNPKDFYCKIKLTFAKLPRRNKQKDYYGPVGYFVSLYLASAQTIVDSLSIRAVSIRIASTVWIVKYIYLSFVIKYKIQFIESNLSITILNRIKLELNKKVQNFCCYKKFLCYM